MKSVLQAVPEVGADPESRSRRRLLGLLAATLALTGCGGGGGSTPAPAPGPGPGPGPSPPPPQPGPPPPAATPTWAGFARDAQHSALSSVASQDLNRIAWQTPVDLAPPYANGNLQIHYGSPVVTASNTVLVPVKTSASGGFRIDARAGSSGSLLWSATSDYLLPPVYDWVPSWNLALDASNRVWAPAAGGRLLVRSNADAAAASSQTVVFYGATTYAAAPSTYDASVFINTPLTVDAQGTVYFGFIVTGSNPAGLKSGLARVAADGSGSWVAAATAAADAGIDKVAMNSAPALSIDGATLYVAVNVADVGGSVQRGTLLALDSRTLATLHRAPLFDPSTGAAARVTDDSTASPTVGPDGDVYFGVLEANYISHNDRGWLLHFDASLTQTRTPGSFGWDDTASLVPAAMVPSYSGSSTYLLMTKYNNYEGVGTGDGLNRIAILDPNASQADTISGVPVMREVLTILGPTPEGDGTAAVKEWCINTAAVDAVRGSVLANCEDGWLYRWDLKTNSFSQRIQLTSGLGEAYTPTLIGADGAVYAVNNAVLFSLAA